MIVRQKIICYGRVQGVGFRYCASHMAPKYGITGNVQNNSDGSVEMIVQGEEAQIDLFLSEVGNWRYIEITRVERTPLEVVRLENDFVIKDYY